MPRPPRICPCNITVPHGERCRCEQQATRERNARHDRRRLPACKRGYDHEWRKARVNFLADNPRCAMPGCDQPSAEVDHIIPHRGDRALFWNRRNWQALCPRCHRSVKQRIERSIRR